MVSESDSFREVTNLFYTAINTNVSSVTLDDASTVTVQSITFAWPERKIYEKTDFPIIVIRNEDAFDEEFVYSKEEITNRVSIEVSATSTQSMSRLLGACYNTIKNYKNTFRENGITNIRLVDKDDESEKLGSINVRRGLLVFEVNYKRDSW